MIDSESVTLGLDLTIWTIGSLISLFVSVRTLKMLQLAKVFRTLCSIIIWLIIISSVATIFFTVNFFIFDRKDSSAAIWLFAIADAI